MSDQPPRTRRSAPRIVPITAVESSSAAQRSASAFKALPTRPTVRARAYGAPLIAGNRPSAPVQAPNGRAGVDDPDQATDIPPPKGLDTPAGRVPYIVPHEADDNGVTPVVFWDQPPRPESEIDENDMLPPWVSDVRLSPTEAQYQDLGTYLSFMAAGFSDFCRSQYIVESGQWQGRMRMPQKILPETMLQLEVSAFHATLRFETDHPVAREILRRHCDSLRDEVTAALEGSRPVEVSVW